MTHNTIKIVKLFIKNFSRNKFTILFFLNEKKKNKIVKSFKDLIKKII